MKRYVSTRGLILTIIIVSGVLWGLWFISTQVSILKRKDQELAMKNSPPCRLKKFLTTPTRKSSKNWKN